MSTSSIPLPLVASRARTAGVADVVIRVVVYGIENVLDRPGVRKIDGQLGAIAGDDRQVVGGVGGRHAHPAVEVGQLGDLGIRADAELAGGGAAVLADREVGAAEPRADVDAVARVC